VNVWWPFIKRVKNKKGPGVSHRALFFKDGPLLCCFYHLKSPLFLYEVLYEVG